MLSPGEIFFSFQLRSGLSWPLLIPAIVSLAGLLSYASFTDLYRQRIIRNWTSLATVILCWSLIPLIFVNPGVHFAWGTIPVIISFLLFLSGGQGGGDLKLYLGLGPLFGPAGFLFFIISSIVVLVYSLPLGIKSYDRQKPFGQRLGQAPAAPGIALAVPLTAAIGGAPLILVAASTGLGVGLFLLWRFWPTEDRQQPGQPMVWPQDSLPQ